jgi:hypothetical protein
MDEDALLEKWNSWLDIIQADIQNVLTNHHIYLEVQEIINKNPKIQIGSAFYELMADVYHESMVMGIRRQLDNRKDSISLKRLLDEIIQNTEILSRNHYVKLYKILPSHIAHRDFDNLAGEGREYFEPIIAKEDLRLLELKAKNLKTFGNKKIAHMDKSELNELPTYGELNDCIEYLKVLIEKYLRIFRAGSYEIIPAFQYDWKEIFKYPWIENPIKAGLSYE